MFDYRLRPNLTKIRQNFGSTTISTSFFRKKNMPPHIKLVQHAMIIGVFVLLMFAIVGIWISRCHKKEPFVDRDTTLYADKLKDDGYIIIESLVSSKHTNKLRKLVWNTVEKSEVEVGNINTTLGSRVDLHLPITKSARIVIDEVYQHLKHVFDEFDTDPAMIEHSCFLNFPGSHPQNWHQDVSPHDIQNGGKLFTIGVALIDILEEMGPLQVIPQSHRVEKLQEDLNQRECNYAFEAFCGYFHDDVPHKSWTAKRGDVFVWDSALLHRSGPNRSTALRPIYYFSVLLKTDSIPEGSTHSIMMKYRTSRIRINNIKNSPHFHK